MAQKKIQPDQLDVSIVTQSELDAAIAAIPAGDVTLTGAQTLTNKTLMSPKINEFLDTNGNKVMTMNPVTSAVNYIRVDNNATGSAPAFIAVGTDTDIGINFIPKNTGRVQISGVNIPSISSTDVLTNKSLQDSTTFIVDETDATKRAQFQASGITTGTTRTYTLPNSNGTLLSSGVTVTVAQGGTGRSTATTAYGVLAAGTTATGIQQTIPPGTTGQFLKSNGAAALGSFASIAEADVTNLVTDLAAKAPLASPTFTGTPTAPTPTVGDDSTKIATTAFVQANSAAGYVAQATAPADTEVLWYDTDDNGDSVIGNHADTVDGFHASATPTVNTIPVLDDNARMPISTLGGAWTPWTPTITSGTGAFTTVTGSGRYTQIGKTVTFSLKITEVNVGTAGGSVNFTLPVTALNNPVSDTVAYGREDAGTGWLVQAKLVSATVAGILKYDNTGVIGNGYTINLKGTYEAA